MSNRKSRNRLISSGFPGVTRTSLWNARKEIRKSLKRAPFRDVLDALEYDIDPDKWISRLLRDLKQGTYRPEVPTRQSLAKSNGFSVILI